MKKHLFILISFVILINCAHDRVQESSTVTPLDYNNGKLSTGTVSTTGLIAPQGYEFSEIRPSSTPGISCFYLNFQEKARYSVSDDFVIPQNEIWNVKNISFYVINPDPVSANFSVKNIVMEIYDGNPDLATSKKVYGNLDTNLFKSSAPTNIYRITNETTKITDDPSASLVYKVETTIGNDLNLKAGHYWYQMTMKFDYGEDWSCYIPRLPQKGNNENSFNAYYKNFDNGLVFKTDNGVYNGTIPVNYETPFQITGVKTTF
ncbi:hypothetical protein Q73A0000_14110 [Kaistella flava (ex Peng et al. 2021)]|uniref:Uncharacterized protein n=1 Tax=Kaistella flava (ex Peng et al. 2021) TaxID=2038776 RepID=A0A7M2YCP1_9FLAO|nr:hypothetical protein [Kaistella flava (ex Peng et al. 2021)]QOW11415.1 hypothetical protein Q73A0000_14110 [Kaistella flava (ex Peng et al. 2021)]